MRRIAFILALCTVLLLCAGCGAAAPEPAAPEAVPVDETVRLPMPDAALEAMLGQIHDRMHIGTAGGSLKAASLAVELLNWGADTEASAAGIRLTLDNYLAALEPEAREEFLLQLQAVDSRLQILLIPGEEAEALLSDAGCEDMGYPWNDRARTAAEAVMEAAGLRA